MHEAEEKIKSAKTNLYYAVANAIKTAMINQGKTVDDVYEVAKATECFMALTDKEQNVIIKTQESVKNIIVDGGILL